MGESICLDKHEMVVDRDHYEAMVLRISELEKALLFIGKWDLPKFPSVNPECSVPVNFESKHGSNRARDYVRTIAYRALGKGVL